MLCDIFPAPSSTEIRADWTKERRDHNVTQADTERHQPQPATRSLWLNPYKFHHTERYQI